MEALHRMRLIHSTKFVSMSLPKPSSRTLRSSDFSKLWKKWAVSCLHRSFSAGEVWHVELDESLGHLFS